MRKYQFIQPKSLTYMLHKIISILFLTFFSLSIPHTLKAQSENTLEFGLKAGFNMNKLIASQADWESDDLRLGFVTGAFLRINFEKFFIQPEFLLSQKGGNLRERTALGFTDFRRTIGSVDVPFMVGVRFLKFMRLNVGPVLMFPIGGNQSEGDEEDNYGSALKNTIAGYQAGIGIDIKRVRLDLRYESNISKVADDLPNGQNGDDRISTFQVTFGYALF